MSKSSEKSDHENGRKILEVKKENSKKVKKAESSKSNQGKIRKRKPPGSDCRRPVANKVRAANRLARLALASGELAAEEVERRRQMDLRTLYVRFRHDRPKSEEDIRRLIEGIKIVRIPRQCKPDRKDAADATGIKYAYLEFGSEASCEKAKELLELKTLPCSGGPGPKSDDGSASTVNGEAASEPLFYVDHVGEKSKGFTGSTKPKDQRGRKGKAPINPTRLFVSGLTEGMSSEKLRLLFPKCLEALVPKGSQRKGGVYGFVQFRNPADAKAAFDAAQKLTFSNGSTTDDGHHHITVLFAKVSPKHNRGHNDQVRTGGGGGGGHKGTEDEPDHMDLGHPEEAADDQESSEDEDDEREFQNDEDSD